MTKPLITTKNVTATCPRLSNTLKKVSSSPFCSGARCLVSSRAGGAVVLTAGAVSAAASSSAPRRTQQHVMARGRSSRVGGRELTQRGRCPREATCPLW
eukprot:3513288-Prymnesium_polylepis.1